MALVHRRILRRLVLGFELRPVSITYDRSFSTNIALAMTIRCLGPEGHVIRAVPTSPGLDDEVKRSVIATDCR